MSNIQPSVSAQTRSRCPCLLAVLRGGRSSTRSRPRPPSLPPSLPSTLPPPPSLRQVIDTLQAEALQRSADALRAARRAAEQEGLRAAAAAELDRERRRREALFGLACGMAAALLDGHQAGPGRPPPARAEQVGGPSESLRPTRVIQAHPCH